MFVANRVQLIRDNSNINQSHYVDTKSNPANDASRSVGVTNTKKVQRRYIGPDFLWQPEESWSLEKIVVKVCMNLIQKSNMNLR